MRTVASAQAQAREEKRRSSRARLTVLSLGAGVQSTTLALMAARGEIEVPDVAIFADTQWEPRAVYEHLEWLMSPSVLPFPVHRVTAGSIRDDIKRRRTPTSERFAAVPWWIVNPDGTESLGSRQCTSEYKLTPIIHEVRRLLGKSNRAHIPAGTVRVMLGISMDEMIRMRQARQAYMVNVYPLIELGMSRLDCLAWLQRNGFPRPPKSACIGCPFHGNEEWSDMRDNRPDEWVQAVETDGWLRLGDARGMNGTEYMHRDRVPLAQADLTVRHEVPRQFGNECEGMCGV